MQINVQANKLTSPVYVEVQGHQNINHSGLLEQITVLLIVQESVADAHNLPLHFFSHGFPTTSSVILATGRMQQPSQTSLSTVTPYPETERYFKLGFRLRTNKNSFLKDYEIQPTRASRLSESVLYVAWMRLWAVFKYRYIFIGPGAPIPLMGGKKT